MLRIIAIIAGAIAVAVAGVLAYAATQPDEFRVERSTERVFALIRDFAMPRHLHLAKHLRPT